MKFTKDERGFGVEDSPFMILATIVVLLLVVAIGTNVLIKFMEGNERQAAADAAMEIYKRARLLSLSYDGSTDRFSVSVPRGYVVKVDGDVVTLKGTESGGFSKITEPMSIQGVDIESSSGDLISSGGHKIVLTYYAKDGPRVLLNWN